MIPRVKVLLLAVVICVTAHGTSLPFTKDAVTSQLTHHEGGGWIGAATAEAAAAVRVAASGHSLGNLDKTVDKRTPSSAVEDWSLVCQQLCGAALGGAVCSSYCKNMPVLPLKVQIENANTLMDSKKQFICPQLCGLQLGDEVCTCKNWLADDYYSKSQTGEEESNNICAIFCDQQHVALAGCSPCSTSNDTSENKNDSTSVTSVDNGQLISEVIVLAADVEENTTTTTTTTPDWNQLCASLCKTGDGGSLCNCDLSPFYV